MHTEQEKCAHHVEAEVRPASRWQATERAALRHQRDALGNITVTSLPDGPDLRYLRYRRYGSGHLLQSDAAIHLPAGCWNL